ncbi:SDR family oxidoreductase [uncultured Phenylobacterium sp.]|uniref:SDR family oxidoreductase n=1 Tax=uncultured Phenylobacterium sp. TaxID=349273 RepID=UPI0025F16839|nr:SDR family oxidoreductase [uncultured Phenylobacterium sp.]
MATRGAALITGGSRRIGRALTLAAADAGFDVAIHVRRIDADAEAALADVQARGRQGALLSADLRAESATDLLQAAEAALGPVTLLVNSASLFEDDAFETLERASWDAHLETNLRAPLELTQAFALRLPPGLDGMVVNILDQRVLDPTPEFFSYTISKSALWSATRMLARGLAPRIRVNAIGPGPTLASIHQTDADFAAEVATTLLKRPVDPQEIGAALRYLVDARSVTGQLIVVDAGQHLARATGRTTP